MFDEESFYGSEESEMAAEQEYKTRRIPAFCECCREEDFGTAQELIARGWKLSSREQFCWRHK
jgi:hypothetical protein